MASDSGPESLPALGSRLAHYEVEAELGRGGMGVVYRARDLSLRRHVALKSPLELDRDSVQRFLSEARAASKLSSPYVVGVFEVFEVDGRPWMAMELVHGESLRQRLKRDGPPSLEEVVRWSVHLSEALQAAHHLSLLHRDINPKNVLVDDQGRARLTDFGLAKAYALEDEETGATTRVSLTQSGAVLGTRGYMSPEQVLGRPLDPRSDLFSLGATLYELCSGQPAFRRTASGDVLDAILNHHPRRLVEVRPDTPPEFDRIVSRALAKRADERYASADDLRADLLALRRRLEFESYGHQVAAVTSTASRRWRRRTVAAWLVAFAAILLAARPWRWGQPPAFDPVPIRAQAMVTWPYVETDGRISPDGQWISFVSDRSGENGLWVRRIAGGDPRRVDTNEGVVLGHCWSGDGQELAVLLSAEDATRVDFVTAPLGSWPRLRVTTDASRLVAWRGDRLFVEDAQEGSLWAIDTITGDAHRTTPPDADFEFRRDFAVRDDASEIAFAGVRRGVEQIWVSGLDGVSPRAVTAGEASAHTPRWMGPKRLLYVSNQGGQQGLWTVDVTTGRPEQIPFGQPLPFLEDASGAGRLAAVQAVHEEAHLWRWSAGDLPRRLTAESLGDFHSSYCAETAQLAFTRSLPGRRVGASFLDTSVELADVTASGLERVRTVVAEGTAPVISPDGRYVAYLKRSKTPPYLMDLRVTDLASQKEVLVSSTFQYAGVYTRPPEIRGVNVAWAPDGSRLYFVQGRADFTPSVMVASPPGFDQPQTLYEARGRAFLLDLLVRDGGGLAFVENAADEEAWKVLAWGPDAGVAVVDEVTRARCALSLLGTRDADTLVVLEAEWNANFSQRASLRDVTLQGVSPSRLEFPRCIASTARWADPWLYLATMENGICQVVRADPQQGTIEPVTTNDLPGVTFSGIQALPSGDVVYSRQVVNADIWLLEFSQPRER